MGYPFPQGEFELVDMTIRMFTEPKLIGDIEVLAEVWRDEETRKRQLLTTLGFDISTEEGWAYAQKMLGSNETFIAMLEAEGVDIEYKDGKNGPIPAFAKNDWFMQELLEDENERISALAHARVGIKSTSLQTRAETLGGMAQRGALCVYLRYAGAGTTRWAGGDDSNFQNLKRGHKIRTALTAPSGHLFAAPDASQIECRLLNRLAGQWDVVQRFRDGVDPYAAIATAFYGEPVYKPEKGDPRAAELDAKRGTGKQAELSCGYGCGAKKFKFTAALGTYGPRVDLTLDQAEDFVGLYRSTHPAICGPGGHWQIGEQMLGYLASGATIDWGPMQISDHRIWLPNGTPLIYDTLQWYVPPPGEPGDTGWRLRKRNGWTRMYGAKLVEQTTQALARVKIGEDMKTIRREGLDITGMSHDEPWVLIPEGPDAESDLQFCLDVIASPPWWLPDLPLAAEGKMGKRYSK